nr:transposase [Nuttalliella namaqua]
MMSTPAVIGNFNTMARFPAEQRLEIVHLYQQQFSQRAMSSLTGQSKKTVNRIIRAYRDEGRLCDVPHRRRPPNNGGQRRRPAPVRIGGGGGGRREPRHRRARGDDPEPFC